METWQVILLVLLAIFLLLTLVAVLAGVLYRAYARKCTSQARLDGKTVLITGATAGIGKEAAIILAGRGCRLIIASLYEMEGKEAADEIISKTGNSNVVVRVLDVADLDSVRRFAAKINAEEKALHVLVNNAGIAIELNKRTSPQGFELILATNHYGCFLLTNLLMNKLKSSAPSRIVTAASVLHLFGRVDLNDLNFDTRPYWWLRSYNQSKLCNILFTKELARRLEGTGVTANCLHPGVVCTGLWSQGKNWLSKIVPSVLKIVARTPVQGAQTTIYLSLSEEVEGVSGKYYDNCQRAHTFFQARDKKLASKLWDISCRNVKLTAEEMAVRHTTRKLV